jgi:tricorn protease
MPIWIADLANSKTTAIPRDNSNDRDPMWVGDKVYFASDRKGPFGLFSYDIRSHAVVEEVKGSGFDIKSASAGPGAIVYEKVGSIHLFDPVLRSEHAVPITISGDFPEVCPQIKNLTQYINNVDISPNGKRAMFEARGRIFTVPAEKGDVRQIAIRQGVAERSPAWSPDGNTLAFLSDESGEYKLVLHDTTNDAERSLDLGEAPASYGSLIWSPDSKYIVYTDNRHIIWLLDVGNGKNTKIDTATYEDPSRQIGLSWSPDSKWIAFNRDLDNHLNALFLYSLDANKTTQITDGLSNVRYPVFDRGGKYLYFAASTNTRPGAGWLDLSRNTVLNVVSTVYAMTLAKDTPDPMQPESDEERPKEDKAKEDKTQAEKAKESKKPSFHIDLDGIDQRAVALPMPELNYSGLVAGPEGTLFALSTSLVAKPGDNTTTSLSKFTLSDRKLIPFAAQLDFAIASASGEKLLIGQGQNYSIVSTAADHADGGMLRLDSLVARIDPRAEWAQIYHEAWRNERDFFYDPHYHGIDLIEMERRYRPFLATLCSRDDLNYLLRDMFGELCVSHIYVVGGDIRLQDYRPKVGLLGADYTIENGRYRLSRIYSGESWNPDLRAPLTQPGVAAKVGEYILAIDGEDLPSSRIIDEALDGKAGKQVRLRLGITPDGRGSREVVVIPVSDDHGLRLRAWEEDNRRLVDKLSGGRLGYVYIPDTSVGGWSNFMRYYYSQIQKDGMVIDERSNRGGDGDDYMVEAMSRPLASMTATRYGKDFPSPATANFGPKVLIIDQYAGSGGDNFPWHFKHAHVGPLIGKRTYGGLVGTLTSVTFVDGGYVTTPNLAFYNPNGTWDVENHGVDPDIDVDLDPYQWRQGHDSQLERAVQEALKLLASKPKPMIKRPSYRDKSTLQKAEQRR